MDYRKLESIASLCRVYLTNYDHASRRERTLEIVGRLHEATAPEVPPTLSVHVRDGLAMEDGLGG